MRIIAGILQFIGLGSLGWGMWLYEPWVALAICGSLVMIGGVWLDITAPKPKVEP